MAHRINSLADYATKRFRLAGKAYLEEYNPFFVPTDTARQEAQAHGRNFVSFANYDYLGISGHPAVKAAAIGALEEFGVGALASRLVGGERSSHHVFEDKLAAFLGVEFGSHARLRLSDQCDDHFAHDEYARCHLPG